MKSNIKTTRFWLAWIGASLLVYPLVIAFLIAFIMVLSPIADIFVDSYDGYSVALEMLYLMGFSTIVGGMIGFAIGMLQKSVIKRYFNIDMKHWQRTTVVGGMVAAPAMVFTLDALTQYTSQNYWQLLATGQYYTLTELTNILPMILYVAILSTIQIVILRKYVQNAWLWILANTVAGLMFSMLVNSAFDPGFGNWLLAAIAQGAVTGFAMLWLLHRLNQPIEEEPELAYQHVPIEIDDPSDPSVWDDTY